MSDSDDEVADKKPLKLVFLGEPTVGKVSIIFVLVFILWTISGYNYLNMFFRQV